VPKYPLPKFVLNVALALELPSQIDGKYAPLVVDVGFVIEIAPVPVAPLSGSPLFCQVPFLEKYNLLLSKSNATPIISPVV
jgi:hypothetical protein